MKPAAAWAGSGNAEPRARLQWAPEAHLLFTSRHSQSPPSTCSQHRHQLRFKLET